MAIRLPKGAQIAGALCAGALLEGCATVQANHSEASPWWGLLVAALALTGCVADSKPKREDAGGAGGGGGAGGAGGGGGAGGQGGEGGDVGWWEQCCDNNGQISTCFCEGGGSCNYGWFETCPDGSCTYNFDCNADAGPPDTGPRDTGPPDAAVVDAAVPVGEWEPCCNDGTISSCLCEGGGECNYGWFTPCAAGACGLETCALPNPGDYAVVCCRDGRLTSCVCAAGEPCEANAGGFRTCQSGACVAPDAPCP